MNLSVKNQPNFGANFINTKSFREVLDYAEKNGKLLELDGALNRLHEANTGDILLIHGKTDAGVYSSFRMGHRSVQNLGANLPEEASYKAIVELGELGRKFRRLIGGDVQSSLSAKRVLQKYVK